MQITQIRNATIIINYAQTRFLVDPWLGPKDYMPGFEGAVHPEIRQPRVELPCPIEKITDVDAVILTHVHPDHWDDFAAKALNKNIKIFAQSETDKQFLSSLGFTDVEILTQSSTRFRRVTLFKTPGQHGKREIVKPVCEQLGMPYDAMGVVFKAQAEPTLYLAGDTIWCPEVQNALDTYRPDVIVVNACAASVANGEHLIMGKEDVLQTSRYAPHAAIVASHMDTVSHLTVTRQDLKTLAKENNLSNLFIPNDGETLTFTAKN